MDARIDPVAATGFEAAADAYERARPSYAPAAVAWVAERAGVGRESVVVDLGAGTGKLTRAVVALGARVVAIEPVAAMRAKLVDVLPGIEAHDGTAEALPLPDASADLVAVAQAFHWFDRGRALPEIHRVLRPGGLLALLWNSRELAHPLQQQVEELLAPLVPETLVRARDDPWRDDVAESRLFGPVEHRAFPNPETLTREGLRDRVASTSFVAALPEPERAELLARVEALVDGPEAFPFPYTTDVFLIPRVG